MFRNTDGKSDRIYKLRSIIIMKRIFAALLLTAAFVIEVGCVGAAHASDDVARLIQQLHDPDVQHRRDAARDLSKITPLPPPAMESMAELLEHQDQDPIVARIAWDAVCNAGASAVPIAKRFLESKDKFISGEGINLLGFLAIKDKDVWPILIDIYKKDPASNAINLLAPVGPPALPLLIDALKSHDPTLRAGALMTIETMVGWSVEGMVWNGHPVVVAPKDVAPAEPELAAALADPDPKIRSAAAIVLNYIDPNDKRALPILISLVAERNVQFIGSAIKGLQASGSAAKAAVPALEHLLSDDNVGLRWDAAKALVQIEGQSACAPVAQAIKRDREWRTPLIRTMLTINPPCLRNIPTLIATFPEEYPADEVATTALSKMGSPAVPALAAALKSSNLYMRQNATDTLAGMKPLPPDAVRALLFALKDKNSEVRRSAIAALRTVGGEAQRTAESTDRHPEGANTENPGPDARVYSRKQIAAPIPADAEYMYPLTLAYLVPITEGAAAEANIFISVHAGKDRSDRMVFWRKIGEDQYQQDQVLYSEEEYLGEGNHFEVPFTFHAAYQSISDSGSDDQTGLFVDAPVTDGFRMYQDNVFVVADDHLAPVQVDSSCGGSVLQDQKLEFTEPIFNREDATCCPTGGTVTGTCKVIEDTKQSPSVWKIVVATRKRIPAAPKIH